MNEECILIQSVETIMLKCTVEYLLGNHTETNIPTTAHFNSVDEAIHFVGHLSVDFKDVLTWAFIHVQCDFNVG